VISDIAAIMGTSICYRDGNVAKYRLENALPVDTILLEVVAPTQGGTAAGRFLDKTGNRGGYMAIFCWRPGRARRGRMRWACARRTSSGMRPITACNCIRATAALPSSNSTMLMAAMTCSIYPPQPDWQKSIRGHDTGAY
jgi:hypothetical protein